MLTSASDAITIKCRQHPDGVVREADRVRSKNSILSELLGQRATALRVLGCVDASGYGSVFIFGCLYRRLDEPASTACHRISHRGESCFSRADWQSADAV